MIPAIDQNKIYRFRLRIYALWRAWIERRKKVFERKVPKDFYRKTIKKPALSQIKTSKAFLPPFFLVSWRSKKYRNINKLVRDSNIRAADGYFCVLNVQTFLSGCFRFCFALNVKETYEIQSVRFAVPKVLQHGTIAIASTHNRI